MKNLFLIIILSIQTIAFAQDKKIYYKAGAQVDTSLIDENVGDNAKKVNTVFLFKNGTHSYFIKIMNLEGKIYAQGISEYVVMDFNSKKGGDLHRKVEKLTNIKIEDGKFTSDQLKASFVFLKEKGANYENSLPPINIMVCSQNKSKTFTSCKLNDSQEEIDPSEIPGKYPQSAVVRLGDEDLRNKKPKELAIMKNEIYARYGYRFSDKNDQDYFFNQSWYEPVVDNKLIQLNELEEDNVNMITLYENKIDYKSLNNKSYSYILPLETSSSTLYDKNALKSIKYVKQDTIGNSRCEITKFNKNGISLSKDDCMINKPIYVNYFHDNFLVENVDQKNDSYFYYDKNGLPIKKVKLDYENSNTEETYYYYDENQNINKKEIYKNNDYDSSLYFSYDQENNIVKEFSKDEDGKEVDPIQYFYDEDNLLTGYLKNKLTGCDYSFNETKDIMTKTECFRVRGRGKEVTSIGERKVIESSRGKQKRLSSFNLSEQEGHTYGLSITELQYY